MNKRELLKVLEPLDDEALIYIQTEDNNVHLLIKFATDIVTGEDVQNEITLYCE